MKKSTKKKKLGRKQVAQKKNVIDACIEQRDGALAKVEQVIKAIEKRGYKIGSPEFNAIFSGIAARLVSIYSED